MRDYLKKKCGIQGFRNRILVIRERQNSADTQKIERFSFPPLLRFETNRPSTLVVNRWTLLQVNTIWGIYSALTRVRYTRTSQYDFLMFFIFRLSPVTTRRNGIPGGRHFDHVRHKNKNAPSDKKHSDRPHCTCYAKKCYGVNSGTQRMLVRLGPEVLGGFLHFECQ